MLIIISESPRWHPKYSEIQRYLSYNETEKSNILLRKRPVMLHSSIFFFIYILPLAQWHLHDSNGLHFKSHPPAPREEEFPGQMGYIIPAASSGFTLGSSSQMDMTGIQTFTHLICYFGINCKNKKIKNKKLIPPITNEFSCRRDMNIFFFLKAIPRGKEQCVCVCVYHAASCCSGSTGLQ